MNVGIIAKMSFLNMKSIANGMLKVKYKILLIMKATRALIKNQPKKRLANKFLLIKISLLTNKFSMLKI
jgi:hypothetical protein